MPYVCVERKSTGTPVASAWSSRSSIQPAAAVAGRRPGSAGSTALTARTARRRARGTRPRVPVQNTSRFGSFQTSNGQLRDLVARRSARRDAATAPRPAPPSAQVARRRDDRRRSRTRVASGSDARSRGMNDSSTIGRRPVSSSRSQDRVDPRRSRSPGPPSDLAVHAEGVVEDRRAPGPPRTPAPRGRSGTPRPARRRRARRRDPRRGGAARGAPSRSSAATAAGPGPRPRAASTSTATARPRRPRPAPSAAATGADSSPTGASIVGTDDDRVPGRRPAGLTSCRRTARAAPQGRRRRGGRSARTARRPPARDARGSRPRRRPADQSIVTWPRPRRRPHVARRRQRDVGRRSIALDLGADLLEPGDTRAGGRRQCRIPSAVSVTGPAPNCSCPMTGLSDRADVVRRERVAQHVVRPGRCRSRP